MASNATFTISIDESGQEGGGAKPGTSRWFVMGGAIFRRAEEIKELELLDEVRQRINQGRKPDQHIPVGRHLHFRDLKHEQRKYYTNRIAQARVKTIAVLIDKHLLTPGEMNYPRLYPYAARLLLEQACLCCRDWLRPDGEGDGSLDVVFSHGHNLRADAMRLFVEELADARSPYFLPAATGILRPDQTATFKPGKRRGLQIADAVASSYFLAVEPSEWGLVEDGYARLLRPCAYHHSGQVWQRGIRLVPEYAEEAQKQSDFFMGWKK